MLCEELNHQQPMVKLLNVNSQTCLYHLVFSLTMPIILLNFYTPVKAINYVKRVQVLIDRVVVSCMSSCEICHYFCRFSTESLRHVLLTTVSY